MLIPFKTLVEKYKIIPSGVLHIGANDGYEIKTYIENGCPHVIFIEAENNAYERLKKNTAPFNYVLAIQACIADEDGRDVFFRVASNDSNSSSILKFGTHSQVHPDVTIKDIQEMKTQRTDTLLAKRGLDLVNYDFLNIDLQGAELMALKGMGEELKKIRYAYIEVNKEHLYENCPLIGEIDEYLNTFGFERVETSWAGDTGWGDAFYMKIASSK